MSESGEKDVKSEGDDDCKIEDGSVVASETSSRGRKRERDSHSRSSSSGSESSSRSRSPKKERSKSRDKHHNHRHHHHHHHRQHKKHDHKSKSKSHHHHHSKKKHRSSSSGSSSAWSRSSSSSPERAAKREAEEDLFSAAANTAYSDGSNPFHDANLSKQFIWKAKIKKMKAEGKDVRKYLRDRNSETRSMELRVELERAKQRRLDKEAEREMWQKERERMEREANRAEFGDYDLQEKNFVVLQTAKRAQIRVAERRARPLDRLFIALSVNDPADAPTVGEEDDPVQLIQGCRDVSSLTQMRDDAKAYVTLAQEGRVGDPEKDSEEVRNAIADKQIAFFGAFVIVCDDTLRVLTGSVDRKGLNASVIAETEALLKQDDSGRTVNRQVLGDIVDIFEAKTSSELDALRSQMTNKVHGGNVTDMEYWQHLLSRLDLYRAKAVLREIHREIVNRQLDRLDASAASIAPQPSREDLQKAAKSAFEKEKEELLKQAMDDDEDEFETMENYYDPLSMLDENNIGEAFNNAVPLPPEKQPHMHWAANDKYRPRKPRFFNRVFAGYDWSRYNRTHYDHDNPPPKVVKGYKFNIFYPDLLDKTVTPTFYLEEDPEGDKEFCLLRFHAGPPYEDVAFRIPNRPWDRMPKFGYRCYFDRGILHLWFHFRRLRYRK